jgi:hypothetical protein
LDHTAIEGRMKRMAEVLRGIKKGSPGVFAGESNKVSVSGDFFILQSENVGCRLLRNGR